MRPGLQPDTYHTKDSMEFIALNRSWYTRPSLILRSFRVLPACGIAILALSTLPAIAQTDTTTTRDTIRSYRLGQVVVSGTRSINTAQIRSIPLRDVLDADAPSIAALGTLVPSARVQTNSRGEALLYLRGSGERQIALFFDGALMNVAWDNRVDLSLIPTAAIGGVGITRGVPSVLWGANVLGGAVNVSSQELTTGESLTQIAVSGGENGFYNGSITRLGSTGGLNYIASVGATGRDGIPLPNLDDLRNDPGNPIAFNQPTEKLRTNTASRTRNGFLRAEYRFSDEMALGVSFHAIDAAKGVAPEGHIQDARFWRYADWTHLTATLSGDARFGDENEWNLRGSWWWNGFRQTIDQYANDAYRIPTDRQEDDDATIGGRIIVEREYRDNRLALAVNVLTSGHDQRDLVLDSSGIVIDGETTPTLSFRQVVINAGIEGETRIARDISVTAGFGYDMLMTPMTGDKPARDGQSDIQLTGGVTWKPYDGTTIALTTGRKTRFPTLRELFGEALRRFIINPDLKPEDATMVDLSGDITGRNWNASGAIFARVTSNVIDQRNVPTPSGTKRQRVNLPGSRIFGVETSWSLRPVEGMRLEGNVTWLDARGRATAADGSDSLFTLTERPEYLGMVSLSYRLPFGLEPALEAELNGPAMGLGDDNRLIDLPAATLLNLRLSYRYVLPFTRRGLVEAFIRANNILDAVSIPQLGLPGAGRELLGGIKMTL